MTLDLAAVRSRFPGLATDWTLLDNAGGSQILDAALERIRDYLVSSNVQIGGTYAQSALVAQRMSDAAREIATLMNAPDPREIVTGSSTTQLLLNLSLALQPTIRAGDELVVSTLDHESNVGPWVRLAERTGASVKFWRPSPDDLALHAAGLERLLTDRTRLVAFTHVSNVVGAIHDVATLTRLIRDAGAISVVDGVAFAPHRAIDVEAFGADAYVFSGYKVCGPHMAVLRGRAAWLESLPSINHFFIPRDALPKKLQPGGAQFELVHGFAAVPGYLASLGQGATTRERISSAFERIAAHEEALAQPLLDFLASRRGVRIIGPRRAAREVRVPTVSFAVNGRDAASIPPLLDRDRTAIRWGDFYATRLIDELGLTQANGVVRVSFVHYNTPAEVARVIELLDRAL